MAFVSMASALAACYHGDRACGPLMTDLLDRAVLFRIDIAAAFLIVEEAPKVLPEDWEAVRRYILPPYPVTLFENPVRSVTIPANPGLHDEATVENTRTGVLIVGNQFIPVWQIDDVAGAYPYRATLGDPDPDLPTIPHSDKDLDDKIADYARGHWGGLGRHGPYEVQDGVDFVGASILGGPYLTLGGPGVSGYGFGSDFMGTVAEAMGAGVIQRMMYILAYLNMTGRRVELESRKPKRDGKLVLHGAVVPRYYHSVVKVLPESAPHKLKGDPTGWPGPRKMNHPVRSHVRTYHRGTEKEFTVPIAAHRRGDERLGIKTSEYLVAVGSLAPLVPAAISQAPPKDTGEHHGEGDTHPAAEAAGEG